MGIIVGCVKWRWPVRWFRRMVGGKEERFSRKKDKIRRSKNKREKNRKIHQ